MSRVIVLWSGGKDAMQALCHAREAGHQVVALYLCPARTSLSSPSPVTGASAGGGPRAAHLLITIKRRSISVMKRRWRH